MFTSCVKENFAFDQEDGGYQMVETSLDLSIARDSGNGTGTRSIDDPEEFASTAIRNLNILQFDGTTEDSRIIGEVRYLSDDVDSTDKERYLKLDQIRMAESKDAYHTVVFLANVFTKVPQVKTLKEMKDYLHYIEKEADLFGYEGDGKDFPNGGTTYYQRLNGIAVTKISNGTVLRAALRRSMAKVRINIRNTREDNLVIDNVQLCNVSQKDWFLTNYTYFDTDTQDDDDTKELFPGGFVDAYNPEYPSRMNYDPRPWASGVRDNEEIADFLFYVPANQRGVCKDDNHPAQEKNRCARADGATYVRISGRYGANQDTHIVYTYYLGGNLKDDFNICPNKSYVYNFVINGKGNSTIDDRIEDMKTVDFELDANSYILNPPISHTRSYTFNAIHRPNIFWGTRYGVMDSYPNYIVDDNKQWNARILWSDFKMTKEEMDAFLTRSSGNGSGSYMSDNQRIKVTVPTGMKTGNVVIGMYLGDSDNCDPNNIIWSWHLWITDYNPDDIVGRAPVRDTVDDEGNELIKYIYDVTNGEVHRYGGVSWRDPDGKYYNGYAMDRNLGAHDTKSHSENGAGLTYQFGRKDPICKGNIYVYDVNGEVEQTKPVAIASSDARLSDLNGSHVPYFVNHPLEYISSGDYYWTSNDVFNPDEYDYTTLWFDPYDGNHTIQEEDKKSIFDPCPPGWCLPEAMVDPKAAWKILENKDNWVDGFSGDNLGYATTSDAVNMQWDLTSNGMGAGRVYHPRGFLASKDDPHAPAIFFPGVNNRFCYYYTANPFTKYGSRPVMVINSTFAQHYGTSQDTPKPIVYGRTTGFVRCVRKSY